MLVLEREDGLKNMELQAARKSEGMTQKQVAEISLITERQYQDYEYGKSEPGVRTAIRIGDAVGAETLDDFKKLWQSPPGGNPASE